MRKEESFTEKTLNRIRTGEAADDRRKKRRFSRIFIIVDLILILGILIYFTSDRKDDTYKTSPLSFGSLDIRFSVAQDKNKEDYLLSISISSTDPAAGTYRFDRGIASISVSADGNTLKEIDIGKEITALNFHKDEIKTFNAVLDRKVLDDFAMKAPRGKYKPQRTLFGTGGKGLPVEIRLRLNHNEGISTSVDFQHRVEL